MIPVRGACLGFPTSFLSQSASDCPDFLTTLSLLRLGNSLFKLDAFDEIANR